MKANLIGKWCVVLAAAFFVAFSSYAWATAYTWSTGASNSTWASSSNWSASGRLTPMPILIRPRLAPTRVIIIPRSPAPPRRPDLFAGCIIRHCPDPRQFDQHFKYSGSSVKCGYAGTAGEYIKRRNHHSIKFGILRNDRDQQYE